MPEIEDNNNFQFNYNKLYRFLAKSQARGFVLAQVDDARYISQVNKSLIEDLREKIGITAHVLFLSTIGDKSIFAQIEEASTQYDALLIPNLYDAVIDTDNGRKALTELNFARESLNALPARLVFWVQSSTLQIISNLAADLYSQRALSTVHFTGSVDSIRQDLPRRPEWDYFTNTENFKETEARINTLERRLIDARKAGYPLARIAEEIVLPLVNDYATLGIKEKADAILEEFMPHLNQENAGISEQLVEVHVAMYKLPEAIKYCERLTKILQNKLREKPQNISIKSDLALAYGRLGDIYKDTGDLSKSLRCTNKTVKFFEALCSINPNSERTKLNLCVSYGRLGDIYRKKNGLDRALNLYNKRARLSEELFQANPESENIKNCLAVSYLKLGEFYIVKKDTEKALELFNKYSQLVEELYQVNPNLEGIKRNLSISYSKLGDLYFTGGDFNRAFEFYKKTTKLSEELYQSDPRSINLYNDLAASYSRIGLINIDLDKRGEARSFLKKAKKIWEELVVKVNIPEYEENLNWVKEVLSQL